MQAGCWATFAGVGRYRMLWALERMNTAAVAPWSRNMSRHNRRRALYRAGGSTIWRIALVMVSLGVLVLSACGRQPTAMRVTPPPAATPNYDLPRFADWRPAYLAWTVTCMW